MARHEIRENIDAPPEKVFQIFADLSNAERNIESIKKIEMLTEGAVGQGTRWRETREIFGKQATEEMWISDWRPPRAYTVACDSCGVHYETELVFQGSGSGTEVVMRMHVKPQTLKAKLLAPLGILFAGVFKKCMRKDIDDLRKKLGAN